MSECQNEKLIMNKRIVHNHSTPQLFESVNFNKNKTNKFSISHTNNKKFNFKKKLSPLLITNYKLLNRMTRNKIVSNFPFTNRSILSSNINNDIKINTNDGHKEILSRGELANENANMFMSKYFYPDDDESHEKSNKINEEININNIMTFYSKIKYNKEREEIKKIIRKQKKEVIFPNHEEDNYNLNKYSNIIPSSDIKSALKKTLNLNNNNEKNISKNNFIILDLTKKIYHSPFHSLDIIKKNKLIYDNILKDYNKNRIQSYKGLEKNLNPLLKIKLNFKKHNNIKILPFIQKIEDPQYLITNKNEDEGSENKKSSIKKKEEDNHKETLLLDFTKLLKSKKGEKYLLYNKLEYPNKNFPESRSEFVFVQDGKEIILHGGYNVSRKYNLWKFNPNQKSWNSIVPTGIKSEIRYAHTGVLHFRNLYIFGGKNFRGTNFSDLEIFNLDKKNWIFPKSEGKRVPLRRNHVACGVGHNMFIHGGISEENKYLDDLYIFNYKLLKWEDIDINYSNKIKLPTLAHHSCCLVVSEMAVHNPKFNIYNCPDIGRSRFMNKIKEKGIYIFGGKILEEGPINNNLYVLKIGKKPLELEIINTSGIRPCARYNSSLNFYERGNMLIIHGGRTIIKKKEIALNDTFILDLFSFNWIEVEYFNKECKVPPRYFHQAIIIKGDLFIFGGMNINEYIGSEMLILDLNSNSKCFKEKNIFLNKANKQNILLKDNKKSENKEENNYNNI